MADDSLAAMDRNLARLLLRIQILFAAALTVALGCFALPAQFAAQRYDTAPRCAGTTQGPDCIARVPVTVASIGEEGDKKHATYWLDLTGLGSGQTQFSPADSRASGGLVGWVTPGRQVTAVVWHGDLVAVESAGTTDPDSGSPDIAARNWLGGFAVPCGLLLGLLIIYVGRRASSRGRILLFTAGALIMADGVAFLIIQDEISTGPNPILALVTLAGLATVVAGFWGLGRWLVFRAHRKTLDA